MAGPPARTAADGLADREPLVPGQPTQLDVGLIASDAVLQPGHRLRVDIYAANIPKGFMVPALMLESQLRPQHLLLDPAAPQLGEPALGQALLT
ncbi:CocE/NonD family hydrolase C-terminal non-catalytic domain-containing protein [Nocardia sp. NPDC020380]|uniref:CocE/NonD family hydrolase C-terminal non-catalytic domain-containing protein n=1 Tax=Nocardia sp. NPDC020380 TaxID=3364309 RepID=UPI00379C5DD4